MELDMAPFCNQALIAKFAESREISKEDELVNRAASKETGLYDLIV